MLAKHKFVEQGVVELCVEYVGRRLREITRSTRDGGESGQGEGVDVIAKKLVEMEFEVGRCGSSLLSFILDVPPIQYCTSTGPTSVI